MPRSRAHRRKIFSFPNTERKNGTRKTLYGAFLAKDRSLRLNEIFQL